MKVNKLEISSNIINNGDSLNLSRRIINHNADKKSSSKITKNVSFDKIFEKAIEENKKGKINSHSSR